MTAIPKPVRERDEAFGAFIREHRCCLPTLAFPHACYGATQAHHVSPRNGTKGLGSKVSDRRQVPVCEQGHRYCERNAEDMLPYLEAELSRLNREYDAMRPAKPKRARSLQPIVQSIAIRCACGSQLRIPASKAVSAVTPDWDGVLYHCSRCGDKIATFRRAR